MNNTNTNTAKETDKASRHIVIRNTDRGTLFLVSKGRWSNEYPDAAMLTYAEARRLACSEGNGCQFGKAEDYQ